MTRMHCTFLAPELSATSSIERGWIIGSGHPAQDLADAPALVARQRPGLLDEDAVADLALVGLVVRLETLRHADDALVLGMAVHPLDADHSRLLHGVAHHDAFLISSLAHRRSPRLLAARAAPCERARGHGALHARATDSWPRPWTAGSAG